MGLTKLSCDPKWIFFPGRHLSNHMIKRESRGKEELARKMSRAQSQLKNDEDVFLELIIDELKRENHELKFALVAREEKLMVSFFLWYHILV